MKKSIFLLSIIIPLFAFNISSVVFSGIISAFQTGNANTLSSYFDSEVEISILDDDNVYPKAQAKQIMEKFFTSYKPASFAKQHEGTSPSGANYCIGILKTSKGTFRVSIHATSTSGKKVVKQVQIEEE
jgi:hypothetical protein